MDSVKNRDDNTYLSLTNIGPRECRKKLISGLLYLLIASAILVVMHRIGLSRLWRIGLIFPLNRASLGFFQFTAKTCTRLAAEGVRNLDDGRHKIENDDEVFALLRKATGVVSRSFFTAVILTLLSLVFY